MRPRPSIARLTAAAFAAAVGVVAPAAFAQVDGSVMYRCPGNDYRNTISVKEAERLGCKRIEGAPVTVIQTVKPRGSGGPVAGAGSAASGASATRIDPVAQRARDSDARRILEGELRLEEGRLGTMQQEFNNGEPERRGDEKNYQKYIDRVGDMRAAIARKQNDIGAIRRELQKLPPPPQ